MQKFPGFLYMWRIYESNQFGMYILIPPTMLYFEYWIVYDYLSHWMDANYTSQNSEVNFYLKLGIQCTETKMPELSADLSALCGTIFV